MNELKNLKFWLTSMFMCFSMLASFAHVAVYPAPEGVKTSNRYEVAVQQNGLSQQSFVYLSSPLTKDDIEIGDFQVENISVN